MPTPALSFANNLQNVERLDLGLAFGNPADLIEELVRSIPVLLRPGSGESYAIANSTDLSSLSAFRAVGTSPVGGTPGNSGVTFTYQRVTSLSEPDVTLSHANRQPNDILEADRAARETSILRLLGSTLLLGDNTATGGFLGWENMTRGTHRTDLPLHWPWRGAGAGDPLPS